MAMEQDGIAALTASVGGRTSRKVAHLFCLSRPHLTHQAAAQGGGDPSARCLLPWAASSIPGSVCADCRTVLRPHQPACTPCWNQLDTGWSMKPSNDSRPACLSHWAQILWQQTTRQSLVPDPAPNGESASTVKHCPSPPWDGFSRVTSFQDASTCPANDAIFRLVSAPTPHGTYVLAVGVCPIRTFPGAEQLGNVILCATDQHQTKCAPFRPYGCEKGQQISRTRCVWGHSRHAGWAA